MKKLMSGILASWYSASSNPHAGVIFLRLGTYAPLSLKIERLSFVLTNHADQLDQFLVVKKDNVRVGTGE